MSLYDFEVLMDGTVVSAERSVRLRDEQAAWPEVERLARHFEPGCRIRVKDETGGIVSPDRRRFGAAHVCVRDVGRRPSETARPRLGHRAPWRRIPGTLRIIEQPDNSEPPFPFG